MNEEKELEINRQERELGYYWVKWSDSRADKPFIAFYTYITSNRFVDGKFVREGRKYGWDLGDSEYLTEEKYVIVISEKLVPPI